MNKSDYIRIRIDPETKAQFKAATCGDMTGELTRFINAYLLMSEHDDIFEVYRKVFEPKK